MQSVVPKCMEKDSFPVETSAVTLRTDLSTFTQASGDSHAWENWLDSSYYTFISLKEVFYTLPCNSILLAPHPSKKEKNTQSKQFLESGFFFFL